ncbi:unnamed protein product [Parajaminaea phylloscopi]
MSSLSLSLSSPVAAVSPMATMPQTAPSVFTVASFVQPEGVKEGDGTHTAEPTVRPDETTTTTQSPSSSAPPTTKSRTLPPEELLASVADMKREQCSGSSSSSTLDTLDLSNRKLGDVPEELAEMIRDDVVRLALAYNLIHTLPRSFDTLHNIRYLNVRSNLISTFPSMLCELPKLEILDISRNKLRKLPSEPGRLVNLRVLSIRQNRLRRLPLWVASMQHVRVLKIEENPLQWPPPHVSIAPAPSSPQRPAQGAGSVSSEQHRNLIERQHRVWIAALKRWMSDNAASEKQREMTEASSGHERGKSSTTSLHGMSAPPPNGPSALSSATSVADHGGSSSSSVAGNMEAGNPMATPPDSADLSMVSAAASSARSSPERTFKIRPLVLTRVASTSASTASMSRDADSSTVSNNGARSASGSNEGHVDTASSARVPRPYPISKSSDGSDFVLSPLSPDEGGIGSTSLSASQLAWNGVDAVASAQPQALQVVRSSTPPLVNTSSDIALSPKSTMPANRSLTSAVSTATSQPFDNPRPAPLPPSFAMHTRSNSHTLSSPKAAAASMSAKKRILKGKKSLPDMRASTTTAQSTETSGDAKNSSRESHRQRSRSISTAPSPRPSLQHAATADQMPTKASLLPAMASQASSLRRNSVLDADDSIGLLPETSVHRKPSARRVALLEAAGVVPAPGNAKAEVEHQQLQRDSYFKRLSTFPPSIYAATAASLSPAVSKTVDATRGILFALSQVHTALKQYTLFASDERISGQFSRVLDVAGSTLAALIDALDRFDSLSLRGQTCDEAVQSVLSTSRASVDTFRKVVSVLKLQLKPLQNGVDVRYTRSLLLMIYGATTEVGNSWREISEAHQRPSRPNVAPLDLAAAAAVGTGGAVGGGLPAIAESASPEASISSPVVTPRQPVQQPRPQRKRHAGSFNAQDVQEGASILPAPPASAPSHDYADVATPLSTPSRRNVRRAANGSDGMSASFSASKAKGDASQWPQMQRSTSASTPLTQTQHQHFPSSGSVGSTAGKAIVDEHLLGLVQAVTSTASGVWIALLEHLAVVVNGVHSPASTPTLAPVQPAANQNGGTRSVSPSPSTGTSTSVNGISGGNRKLHELRSQCLNAAELTRRLQHTLGKVQDEMDLRSDATTARGADGSGPQQGVTNGIANPVRVLVVEEGGGARRLLDESVTFARTVTGLLLHIRSLSVTHAEALSASDLKRNLAALTHGCANLSVHLHFCAPDGGATSNRNRALAAPQQIHHSPLRSRGQQATGQQRVAAPKTSAMTSSASSESSSHHAALMSLPSHPASAPLGGGTGGGGGGGGVGVMMGRQPS